MPTITQILQHATEQLKQTSDSARLDSEILLAYTLNESRSYLYTWPDKQLTPEQASQINELLNRRHNGEPIAYIVGQQEFWSMPLKVTPDTLIPRPETELLVELALQKIPADSKQHILDLGTGSGAIALAIAKERSACQVTGVEHSRQALVIANENAQQLGIRNVSFMHGHWFSSLDNSQRFDLIVSNPPYIACADPHLSQGDVRFEPETALSSGSDGLDDIRWIADGARRFLKTGGWLFMEHGYDQGPTIESLLSEYHYKNIIDHKDLAGLARVVAAQWSK
jgi:release factor glutamine methyltransferase